MKDKLTRATEIERVSELLGLPKEINTTDSLNAKVACGLPVEAVEKIIGVLASRPELNLISDRAFRRAKSEKLPISVVNSQILFDFARTYVVADRIHYGNGPQIMRFLEKPNPNFGGATPMAIAISSPAGADAVIELLNS
jgi:uncharacterized protein (DUF2384 family)